MADRTAGMSPPGGHATTPLRLEESLAAEMRACRALPAVPRWAALGATGLCGLFYFSLPFSTGGSNTAGALLIVLTLVCALRLRPVLAQLDRLLLFAVLLVSMTALMGALVAVAEGHAPWKVVGLHRKELVFIALLLWLRVLPLSGLARRALWGGTGVAVGATIVLWALDRSLQGGPFNPLAPVSLTHAFHNFIVATVCLWMLFYALEEKARLGKRRQWLLGMSALVGLATVLFINSGRTGLLAAATLAVFYVAQRVSRRAAVTGVAALAVGLAALAYFPTPFGVRMAEALHDVREYASGRPVSPVGLRLLFVETSIDLIRERPLLGYGTGSYRTVQDERLGIAPMSEKSSPHPHNDWLHLWFERGILGPIALALVYIALWRAAAKLLPYRRAFCRALLVAFFTASLANSFYMDWASGSFFLGLSALLLSDSTRRCKAALPVGAMQASVLIDPPALAPLREAPSVDHGAHPRY